MNNFVYLEYLVGEHRVDRKLINALERFGGLQEQTCSPRIFLRYSFL